MNTRRLLKVLGLMLTMGAFLLMSCATEVGDIDRTEPNKLKKTDLKGLWFYVQTVIEAPVPAPVTFDGEMNFGGGVRVIFDIQENALVVYPTTEIYVEGAEKKWSKKKIRNYWDEGKSDQFIEMYVGQPLATFEIDSHFDVIRSYNAQTGEQGNILVENTTDRKWYEREYVRVNWAAAGVKDLFFLTAVKATSVDYYVQEFEEDNPDRFEMTENSVNFVTKLFLEPVSPDACSIYDVAPYDCAGAVVKVRHSFRKVDPNNDYITKYYNPSSDQGKFGYFLTERWGWDEDHGYLYTNKVVYANLWNIWVNSRKVDPILDDAGKEIPCSEDVDCEGSYDGKVHCQVPGWFEEGKCVTWDMLPPHERTPKPIVYHVSANWPQSLMASAYESADQWSVPYKEAVSWAQFYSKKGLYDITYCDSDADCGSGYVLDQEFSDQHPRYCNPGTEQTEKLCQMGFTPDVAGYQFCSQAGVCGSPAQCSETKACAAGQACFTGVCYACTDGDCSLKDKDSGWQQVVNTTMEQGAFTLYRVIGANGPEYRESVDDPIPSLDSLQAWFQVVNLDFTVKQVSVVENKSGKVASVCKQGGKNYLYAFETGDPTFRTQGCILPLTELGANGAELHSFDVLDAESGATLGSVQNVAVPEDGVVTLVLVGDGKKDGKKFVLLGSSTAGVVNKSSMMRFVHGIPGEGGFDVAVQGSKRFTVSFGQVTDYTMLAKEKTRVVWLNEGASGEISCVRDNGIGMCMGWKPQLTAADIKERQDMYDALPPLYVVCQNVFNGDNCEKKGWKDARDQMSDCRYWYTDADGKERNPCKEVADPYAVKKHGDIRYNSMYWVSEDQTASPLGYGPSGADPETGEIFYGIANIYGAPMISYGQYGSDLLDLAENKLDKSSVMSGDYIRKYIEDHYLSGATESLYAPADAGADTSTEVPRVKRFWLTQDEMNQARQYVNQPEIKEMLRDGAKLMEKALMVAPAGMTEGEAVARLRKAEGTWLNGLLMNEEVKAAARGTYGSTSSLTAEELARVSPFNWATPEFKRKYREKMHKLADGFCYLSADMYEPYVLGTALKVSAFCKNEKVWPEYGGDEKSCHVLRITKVMLDGVLEHEIGHTVGLRHNFESSADIFNYPDEYYAIREPDYRECTMEGPGSCIFGDYCKVFCSSDKDCMPGTTCKLVEVEGQDEPKKACVDEANEVKGACWTSRPQPVLCALGDTGDAACQEVSAEGFCSVAPEENIAYEKVVDMVSSTVVPGSGKCMVYQRAVDGVCPGGTSNKDGVCLKDDSCDTGTQLCKYDGSRSCTKDMDCQATYVPAFVAPKQEELVKTWVSRGHLTQKEAELGRGENQWASIMDYGGTANFDINGLGKYDKAAIRYAYGGLSDAYVDTSNVYRFMQEAAKFGLFGYDPVDVSWMADTAMANNWAIFSSWLMLVQLVGPKENLERIPVPERKMALENNFVVNWYRSDYDKTYHRVPYVYSGDEWRGNYKTYTFDTGGDMAEIIAHSWNKLHEYYVFDAFKRERWAAYKGANPLGYYARIMDRWFPPIADVGRFYALYWNVFEGSEYLRTLIFSDQLMIRPLLQQAETGLRMLSALLFSPAPGSYRLVDKGTPDERYQNFSYEMGAPGSELDIPVGDGKFPYTTYMADAGYYYFDHAAWIGSFWEKMGALETLTYSLAGFLSDSVGEQVSVGVGSSVGYNTNFYTEMTNLLAGYLVGDRTRYAPYVEDGQIVPFDPRRPQLAKGKTRVEASIEGLSMKTYVGLFGFAYMPSGFDRGFIDSLYLCLKGSGNCFDPATEEDFKDPSWAVKTAEFTDPWSFKTYLARTSNYDSNRINASYDLVNRLNGVKAEWEAITYGDSEEGDLKKDELGAQLRDSIELMDVVVTLNQLFSVLHY